MNFIGQLASQSACIKAPDCSKEIVGQLQSQSALIELLIGRLQSQSALKRATECKKFVGQSGSLSEFPIARSLWVDWGVN